MTTHATPRHPSTTMPCCGQPLAELPRGDKTTLVPEAVDCEPEHPHDRACRICLLYSALFGATALKVDFAGSRHVYPPKERA